LKKKTEKKTLIFFSTKIRRLRRGIARRKVSAILLRCRQISAKKTKRFFSPYFFQKELGAYLRTARPHLSVVIVFDIFAIQEFCYLTHGFSRFGWLCLSSK
jgi:hypothetical protein